MAKRTFKSIGDARFFYYLVRQGYSKQAAFEVTVDTSNYLYS